MKCLDASKVFFSADHHFGHTNIINFSNRPFTNIETMEDGLIKNWNNTVPTDGIVFYLGDFSFHKAQHSKWILEQLNGRIILIKGNHDKCTSYFKEVHNLLEIKVVDNINGNFGGCTLITLCHYAMVTWNRKHYGSYQLFGHSHGMYTPPKKDKMLDVGIDCWDYKPVSYKQIIEKLN